MSMPIPVARVFLAPAFIVALVLVSTQQAPAQTCEFGPLAGAVCSSDADCWACAGGLNNSQGCPSGDSDCPGICGLNGSACFSAAECVDTCVGTEGTCLEDSCVGGASDGSPCASDSDCVGVCVFQQGSSCLTDSDCPAASCSPAFCDTQFPCQSLPVEMTSFDATVGGSSVQLAWTTATETDNAGFEIQSRPGDNAGEDGWSAIAFVDGGGTSEAPRSYEFEVADLSIGTHQFRLKQVDFDGTFDYSEMVEAMVEVPGVYVLEPAYPNPFNPTTTIRFAVASQQSVVVTLHDASGRMVRELYRGRPSANERQSVRIDAAELASGQYQVTVQGETFSASERVMLVK